MSLAFRIAIALTMLCLPVRAQEIEAEAGRKVICDTRAQIERYVARFDGDSERTVQAVNAEINDPTACGVIDVAYFTGAEIGTVRTSTATFHIVRVLVVGAVTAEGLQAAVPMAFFSVISVREYDA